MNASSMAYHPYRSGDGPRVLTLNNEAVPAVSPLDDDGLAALESWSSLFLVARLVDEIVGFVVGLPGPGAPYPSVNYRWFSERYDDFLYIDRIVVDRDAQRGGVGRGLYERAIEAGRGRHRELLAEVNLRPRNDESLAFHRRFGFKPVGEADVDGGAKRVVYLELPLPDLDG